MSAHLTNIFKEIKMIKIFNNSIKKDNKSIDLLINKALFLQNKENFIEAKKLYKELLVFNLIDEQKALVINNLVVVYYNLKEQERAKELFKKLISLREKLIIKDFELYALDYAFTLVMGVEWFNLPKSNLEKVATIAEDFKEIYKVDTLFLFKKIEELS